MKAEALSGGFQNASVQSADSFRVALGVLAHPGRIDEISGATGPAPLSPAAATLVLTLCDRETPLYLAESHAGHNVREWIAFHTGAPIVSRSAAMFALGTWGALLPLGDYATGTAEYPDRSATLIVELDVLRATGPRLTGPGIRNAARLSLPDIEPFVWNHNTFPLGLDFFFTAGDSLAALPRSTRVEGV